MVRLCIKTASKEIVSYHVHGFFFYDFNMILYGDINDCRPRFVRSIHITYTWYRPLIMGHI